MAVTYSPHRSEGGPSPVPPSPFTRSAALLNSQSETPRHSPLSSPRSISSPQTRSATRRQGSLARTQSSPTKIALEISSANILNYGLPLNTTNLGFDIASPELPKFGRQLRGRTGIENIPTSSFSSPLKRRETSMNASETGDLASPRVKRRSQDGIPRSTSRPGSPGSSSDSSTGRTTRNSLNATFVKPLSHTPKRPTSLKKVVNNSNTVHHFEKPNMARSKAPSTAMKPPPFGVSTPLVTSKMRRISSFENFVSSPDGGASFRGSNNITIAAHPIPVLPPPAATSDTPFKKPNFRQSTGTMPSHPPFATPQLSKIGLPASAQCASTGLLSKKNRNANTLPDKSAMPDTPCKKSVPALRRRPMQRQDSFGQLPATPFPLKAKMRMNLERIPSFASVTDTGSPEGSQADSQHDYPGTPTKRLHASDSQNSLRGLSKRWKTSPTMTRRGSPHTPQGSQDNILDASRLSISGRPNLPNFGTPNPQTPRSSQRLFGTPSAAATPQNSSPNVSFNIPAFEQTMTPVNDRTSKTISKEWDLSLETKFSKVDQVGAGEFSIVFHVQYSKPPAFSDNSQLVTPENSSESGSPPNPTAMIPYHYAVKRIQFHGVRDRNQRIEELDILKALGKHKNVIEYVNSWEEDLRLYIQTEYCELGSLDAFLEEYGIGGRIDPFRVWKMFDEITEGLNHIHNSGFVHFDMKPSNVLIGYDGTLKISDFGLATAVTANGGSEREGDREYLAPEVLGRGYGSQAADIFSLGLSLLEIAGNVSLPENGQSWQRLRNHDLSEIPDMSANALIESCTRDELGFPISDDDSFILPTNANDSFSVIDTHPTSTRLSDSVQAKMRVNPYFRKHTTTDLEHPPAFMDGDSLKAMIKWLIHPRPSQRPTTEQLLDAPEIQWVKSRRQCGAMVYEGLWGLADESTRADAMDCSGFSNEATCVDDGEDWIMME